MNNNLDEITWDTELPLEVRSHYARQWRDQQLKHTDWICAIPDHGLYTSYITYRAALRNWPSTSDFPDTKPTL
jgi:hypothetical protein